MSQVVAIFIDSVRALKSRSLFWISLGLSVLSAVSLFGLVSFNDEGVRVLLFKTIESDIYRAGTSGPREWMTISFNSIFVRFWLSWGAIGLGLISTASLIPDFLASGAIDLTLARPISRIKLLTLKFLGGLLFVVVQVSVAVLLAWFLIGVKVNVWLGSAFWAIPLITLQFFYLYAISAFVGVLTRSTIASLLATVLVWGTCSMAQYVSNTIEEQAVTAQAVVDTTEAMVTEIRQAAASQDRALTPAEAGRVAGLESLGGDNGKIADMIGPWASKAQLLEGPFPKTADIQKLIASKANARTMTETMFGGVLREQIRRQYNFMMEDDFERLMDAMTAGERAVRNVNAAASILSSLVMPVLALAAAFWLFVRRDY